MSLSGAQTDVAVMMLSLMDQLQSRVFFYTDVKKNTYILGIQKVAETIGKNACRALKGLHVFTGCDTANTFH